MKAKSLNSRINEMITTAQAATSAGIALNTFKRRALHKGITPTKIDNKNYYTKQQIAILTKSKLVRTKHDALICQLCEDFPYLSNEELSDIVGVTVVKPEFFIFESKINKL